MSKITYAHTPDFHIEKYTLKKPQPDMHYHHSYELYYILEGEREYFIGDMFFKAKKGDLSLDGRLFSVQSEVNVGAVKNAEDTNGLVVRLYEAKGKTTDFTLEFKKDILSVSETDINEASINELEFEGSRVHATIDANSIKTLLVKFK